MIIVSIYFVTTILLLLSMTVYLYCQNRHLAQNLRSERENDNNQKAFVATVVHDLKTPTNAQINTLNLLKNEAFGKLNSEQQEIISLTQESCKYMSNLIGTIMETYRLDLCNISLNKSEFDIVDLIKTVCDETRILALRKGQTHKFNCVSTVVNVYADKLQLKRVIQNLLSNAITYGFNNSVIEISLENSCDSLTFYVKNQSKEIPPNELSTIFNKFQRSKYTSINIPGTGLGLYLVKQIIECHNGKIFAKSSKDGVCIFGFSLPLKSGIKNGVNLRAESEKLQDLSACQYNPLYKSSK